MASRRLTARPDRPQRQQRRKHRAPERSLTDVLHKLVDQSENPALLLELYYWSQEKDLAALMRNYLQLPQTSRRLLSAFLDIAKGDPVSVDAKVCHNGDVVLSSAVVAKMLKTLNQKLDPAAQWPDQAKFMH
jgi:hypothetical protein